jgi:hypothetical protein
MSETVRRPSEAKEVLALVLLAMIRRLIALQIFWHESGRAGAR